MSTVTPLPATDATADYKSDGFVLLRDSIPHAAIDRLLDEYLSLVVEITGRRFDDPFGPDLVEFFNERRDLESEVYLRIRERPWLENFSCHSAIVGSVKNLLGPQIGLLRKIPFRIDMPNWPDEIALWHQDYYYVRGDVDTITAWIPMQDTTFLNGCLSIMPRSHQLGAVPHDLKIGKKSVPSEIFGNEVRFVEMKKGDLLLFHSLLLHTGNLNLSTSIRYSVQARFAPWGRAVDAGMQGIIEL